MMDRFLIKDEDIESVKDSLISSATAFGICVIKGLTGKSLVCIESDSGDTLTGWGFPSTGNITLNESEYNAHLSNGDF